MKNLVLLLMLLVSIPYSYATDFIVSPYVLKQTDDHNILKFRLNKEKELKISLESTSFQKQMINNYREGILYGISLHKQRCGEALELRIFDEKNILFQTTIPAIACHSNEPLKFGFISDTQDNQSKHEKVSNFIFNKDTSDYSFILHAGDVVHKGYRHKNWIEFFDTAKKYLKKLPLIAALGNHSYKEGPRWQVMPTYFGKYLRWNSAPEQGQLHLSYPQVDLIVFNSNFKHQNDENFNKQLDWLDNALAKSRADGKKVIFSMHHSPFSSSIEWIRKIPRMLRQSIVPRLENSGNVVLVLTGHTHMYERSHKKGIHYVIAGPAGGRRNFWTWVNPYKKILDTKSLSFSEVVVYESYLDMITWDPKGKVIDKFKINFY